MSAPVIRRLPIDLPVAFAPFTRPARYKAAYGGRGGGKSWGFATLALLYASMRPGLRVLAVREIQNTLAQSSKRLIEDRIEATGLGERDGFRALTDRIVLPGGGVVTFVGMQDHNADSVKSFEGYDVAWCEEAQSLSQRSLDLLRPTIRAEGSELWFGWNPRRTTDPVDQLFRGPNPPSDSIVLEIGWQDNPWFPPVLEQERLDCLSNAPEDYDHIWEGGYQVAAKGAYYAEQLARARMEGRIGRVEPDPLMTFRVFVDIGGTGAKADAFTMWVAQFVGERILAVNHYEAVGQPFSAHRDWLFEQEYTPRRAQIWLPHDGAQQDKVFDVSYESEFGKAGYTVKVISNQGKGAALARVKAARAVFGQIWFDEANTGDGITALSNYKPSYNRVTGADQGPLHDENSHSADAFGLMAVVRQATPAIVNPVSLIRSGQMRERQHAR